MSTKEAFNTMVINNLPKRDVYKGEAQGKSPELHGYIGFG